MQEAWSSAEFRVRPPLHFYHVWHLYSTSTFTATLINADTWLPYFQAIAGDPAECFRGLLGYFSAAYMRFDSSADGSSPELSVKNG